MSNAPKSLDALFAADRANPKLAERYDWLSPSILRFLRRVLTSLDGHKINGYGDIPASSIVVSENGTLYVGNDFGVVQKQKNSDVWHMTARLPAGGLKPPATPLPAPALRLSFRQE